MAAYHEQVFNSRVARSTSRDLRTELIGAAETMLADVQPVAVPSLRAIARACQVAPSAVYWHFPSEADLRSAVLDAQYADMVEGIERTLDAAPPGSNLLVVAGNAYAAWALAHPGAYQLLFESGDPLPETRAEHGPRLQRRVVELAAAVDADEPFTAALLLWSAWHGLVSLRIHKQEWEWGQSVEQANERIVSALIAQGSGSAAG
jgi:AcrR family transcriptional regulator